jgi:hypothetical protein
MRCFVANDTYADILEIPDPVALKILKYRKQFLQWLYDPKAKHPYRVKVPDGKGSWFYGVVHDTNAFVEWLNQRVIRSKYPPAVIVESGLSPDACPEGMLKIFF